MRGFVASSRYERVLLAVLAVVAATSLLIAAPPQASGQVAIEQAVGEALGAASSGEASTASTCGLPICEVDPTTWVSNPCADVATDLCEVPDPSDWVSNPCTDVATDLCEVPELDELPSPDELVGDPCSGTGCGADLGTDSLLIDDCPEGNAVLQSPTCDELDARALASIATGSSAVADTGKSVMDDDSFDSMFPTKNTDYRCDKNKGLCNTDNRQVTAHITPRSFTLDGERHIRATLDGTYDTTVLNVSYTSSPSYEGGSETDWIYRVSSSSVPAGKDGVAYCDDPAGWRRCDQHYLYFRYATPSQALACHESGHATGLTHGEDASPKKSNEHGALGCMKDPVGTNTYLGSHGAKQINDTYTGDF